jgi:protein-disulfide isomerase
MDPNDSSWADRRMAALDPPASWQPDAAAAMTRFRRLEALRRRTFRVWLGVAAAAACLAALVLWPRLFSPAAPHTRIAPATVTAAFRTTGSAAAPILAEIYSDYECSHCAALYQETVPRLLAEYVATGKLRLLHRDLPLPQHTYARDAARYADAAGLAGYYDAAVDQLFRTQSQWAVDGNIEARLAQVLPPAAMAKVRDTLRDPGQLDASIAADIQMALSDDVRMTPTLVVTANGRRRTIAPVPPYPLLKSYLDDLLRANCREDPNAARC